MLEPAQQTFGGLRHLTHESFSCRSNDRVLARRAYSMHLFVVVRLKRLSFAVNVD